MMEKRVRSRQLHCKSWIPRFIGLSWFIIAIPSDWTKVWGAVHLTSSGRMMLFSFPPRWYIYIDMGLSEHQVPQVPEVPENSSAYHHFTPIFMVKNKRAIPMGRSLPGLIRAWATATCSEATWRRGIPVIYDWFYMLLYVTIWCYMILYVNT